MQNVQNYFEEHLQTAASGVLLLKNLANHFDLNYKKSNEDLQFPQRKFYHLFSSLSNYLYEFLNNSFQGLSSDVIFESNSKYTVRK